MLNEIDKMEKNQHHMILLICVILTQNKQKFKKTHRGTQLISGYQRRKGWREGEMGKRGQLYGDGWTLAFWW